MTKEEAVKAAAMGVPVIYLDPMTEKQTVYRRISAVIWRYATLDNVMDAKRVYVELLPDNGARSASVVPLDRVEIANADLWKQQKDIKAEPEAEGIHKRKPECRRGKQAVFV